MRRLMWTVGVLAVAGAGFAAVTVAGADSGTRYRVAAVTTGDVSQTVLTSGTVDHVNRADVSFGTSGTVTTLSVAIGTTVSAGQELGTLDTASLQAAVDKATSDLDDAESKLSDASSAASSSASTEPSGPSSEQLVQAVKEAQSAASAALKTASDAVAAQTAACADPTATACAAAGSATLTAQQAVKTAQDTLQAKLDALSAAQSAPSQDSPDSSGSADSVAEAQAAVDEAKVKLVEAQQALAGATLTSPITGTVASVSAAAGDRVSAGDAVAVVIGEGAAEVSATVPVERLRLLAVGQTATVTPVGTSEKVPGTVTRVGTLPDETAQTVAYPVTITVDKPPATMAAGTSATAAVVVATAADVLTVPTSAVSRNTVTILNADQTTTVTRVTVGAVGPTRTEIKEGVSAGEQVVLANLDAPVPTSDQQTTGRFNEDGFNDGGPGGGPMMRQAPGGR
ncbi:efflux RND transporter periplasmic adaptor subunit [Actinophytocola sp.]|uniref:efflux RND transporter periplasmic adaptor subunit n=1 Tax=Actinophytocola sp. TaxID=1872138 RepID=UPI002ED1DCC7